MRHAASVFVRTFCGRGEATLLASAVVLILTVAWATTNASAQRACEVQGDLRPQMSAPTTDSGSWSSSDCEAPWREDSYLDRYRLHISQSVLVTIDLTSRDVDTWLRLVDLDGRLIGENDDVNYPDNLNSRISQLLGTGTYYVEASTYHSQATGAYTHGASVDCTAIGIAVPYGSRESLSFDDCRDPYDPEDYADIYSFELSAESRVIIDLESGAFNAFVRLLNDRGTEIESDNDDGSGEDSRIERTLPAGIYQIVATDFSRGRGRGAYQLGVVVDGATLARPCAVVGNLRVADVSVRRTGAWTSSDCRSNWANREYSDRWRLEVARSSQVTIDLISETDAYLTLFGANGGFIEDDDDDGPGYDYNSRIVRFLEAGTYHLEASTYVTRAEGTYELRVSAGVGTTCPATDLGTIESRVTVIGADWTANDCVSSRAETAGSREDLYTFRLAQAGSVQIVLLFEDGPTWVWLVDDAGGNRFVSGQPITVAGMPKGTVITSQGLDGGTSYTISATTPAGSGDRLGSYSLQVVPLPVDRPTGEPEEEIKDRLAVALLELNVNGTYVPANRGGGLPRGTNHDYNDWGCPFEGQCLGVQTSRTYAGRTYAGFPLYSESACNGYVGGHSGWDIQTVNAAGSRDEGPNGPPDVRFRSLTSGILTKLGGDNVNTIAVFDGIKTTTYLHGVSLSGTALADKSVGDLVHIGDPLAKQSDKGSSRRTHVHVGLQDGQRNGHACGADLAPSGRQLTDERRDGRVGVYPLGYLYQAVSGQHVLD